MKNKTKAILLIVISTLFTSVGQLFMKFGADKIIKIIHIINPYMILGGISYVIAFLLFIKALKMAELSLLYPIIATSFIWVNIMAYYFLNEPFNLFKIMGIVFIMVGVGFMGRS